MDEKLREQELKKWKTLRANVREDFQEKTIYVTRTLFKKKELDDSYKAAAKIASAISYALSQHEETYSSVESLTDTRWFAWGELRKKWLSENLIELRPECWDAQHFREKVLNTLYDEQQKGNIMQVEYHPLHSSRVKVGPKNSQLYHGKVRKLESNGDFSLTLHDGSVCKFLISRTVSVGYARTAKSKPVPEPVWFELNFRRTTEGRVQLRVLTILKEDFHRLPPELSVPSAQSKTTIEEASELGIISLSPPVKSEEETRKPASETTSVFQELLESAREIAARHDTLERQDVRAVLLMLETLRAAEERTA